MALRKYVKRIKVLGHLTVIPIGSENVSGSWSSPFNFLYSFGKVGVSLWQCFFGSLSFSKMFLRFRSNWWWGEEGGGVFKDRNVSSQGQFIQSQASMLWIHFPWAIHHKPRTKFILMCSELCKIRGSRAGSEYSVKGSWQSDTPTLTKTTK